MFVDNGTRETSLLNRKIQVMEVVIIEVELCHCYCYFCHEFLKNFCVAQVGLFISELVTKF